MPAAEREADGSCFELQPMKQLLFQSIMLSSCSLHRNLAHLTLSVCQQTLIAFQIYRTRSLRKSELRDYEI